MSGQDAGRLWPTYALRAWLAALLAQTRRVSQRLESRIGLHERMIARLREQLERSGTVIHSLEEALVLVDNVLRRHRDSEIVEAHQHAGEVAPEDHKPPGDARPDQPQQEPGQPSHERNARRRER
jgi:hypothetical protein